MATMDGFLLNHFRFAYTQTHNQSSIAALVKLLSVTSKPRGRKSTGGEDNGDSGDDEDGDESGGEDAEKGTKKASFLGLSQKQKKKAPSRSNQSSGIRRPIIAICNDLYAPALRPLRDIAQVFYVNEVSRDRFVSLSSSLKHSQQSSLRIAS